ncbi:hypothetical protein HWV62_35502 [Athelia sp. TMB]|nr:hypothetical protein HWV62_35502 [Athelia sp. TMB]
MQNEKDSIAPAMKLASRFQRTPKHHEKPDKIEVTVKEAADYLNAVNFDMDAFEDDIRGFSESSKVLMSLLGDVAKIHPAVGAVLSLELKRRDNDKKVVALHLQMQDMMSTLLQLLNIKPDHKGPNGESIQHSLVKLVEDIAESIKNCGNICDTYSKKRLLVKILKSPIYEGLLSDCASTFTQHQKSVHRVLAIHTASKLDSVDERVNSANDALNIMMLFRLLDSPEEKELLQRVKDKGGAKACMKDDSILLELAQFRQELQDRQARKESDPRAAGRGGPAESPGDMPGVPRRRVQPRTSDPSFQIIPPKPMVAPQPLPNSHNTFHNPQYTEIASANTSVAITAMPTQETTSHSLMRVTDHAVYPYAVMSRHTTAPRAIAAHPTLKISDEHLAIVSSLKEELNEDVDRSLEKNLIVFKRQLEVQSSELTSIMIREGDRVIAAVNAGAHERVLDPDLKTLWKEMDWKRSVNAHEFVFALHEYFTEQYSMEAFLPAVKTKTSDAAVVEFRATRQLANKRADNMRTLKYVNMRHMQPLLEAFDDDGSGYVSIREVNELSIAKPDHWRICGIIRSIFQERKNLLFSNHALVDSYLADPALDGLLVMLRSIQPFDDDIDDQFRQHAADYAHDEESRMEDNLFRMAYRIENPSILSLITGPGRVERHILPVVFLVMRHHLRVIRLASRALLVRDELRAATNTIKQILAALQDRATDLDAIFGQQNANGPPNHAQFNKFAVGMFSNFSDLKICDISLDDPGLSGSYEDTVSTDPPFVEPFGLSGPGPAAYAVAELASETPFITSQKIRGVWSGVCSIPTAATGSIDPTNAWGLMEISFATGAMNWRLTGTGVDATGTFEVSGEYHRQGTIRLVLTGTGSASSTATYTRHFKVKKDKASNALVGHWSIDGGVSLGSITLEPVPARLYRFLRPIDPLTTPCNIPRARWLWAKAEVTRRLRPWYYRRIVMHREAKIGYTELYRRAYLSDPMADMDKQELSRLESLYPPADICFWRSLALTSFRRGMECKFCGRRIVGTGYSELRGYKARETAIPDICDGCIDKVWGDVVRCTRFIQKREGPRLMDAAKAITAADDLQCPSCLHETGRQYWVCIECNIRKASKSSQAPIPSPRSPVIPPFPPEISVLPPSPTAPSPLSPFSRPMTPNPATPSAQPAFSRPLVPDLVAPPWPVNAFPQPGIPELAIPSTPPTYPQPVIPNRAIPSTPPTFPRPEIPDPVTPSFKHPAWDTRPARNAPGW